MAFHVWKKALGCTTFQPHWKAFFNPKASLLAQKNDALRLITNWFESHRVIGPIAAKLEEYKKISRCRYVKPDASAVVVGPADLANRYAVDEVTILRVTRRVFIRRVNEVAQAISIDDPKDFDAKVEILRRLRPDQLSAIESLAEGWRVSWQMALAFERELDATAPHLHHSLEEARRQILIGVSELMLSADQPWTECTAPGFLDSGLTVFASTPPRPARGGRVAPGPGFGSRTSPASTARCTSA